MGKKTIGVAPSRVLGLQKDYGWKAHAAFLGGDEQFFDCYEAFLTADFNQKAEFIEKVLGKKMLRRGFVVGEIFHRGNKKIDPKTFEGRGFQSWLCAPSRGKMVRFNDFGKNILKRYKLPECMGDSTIMRNTHLTPMEENQFWVVIYLLIMAPNLCKKILGYEVNEKDWNYLFYVRLSSGNDVIVSALEPLESGVWSINSHNNFDDGEYGTPWTVLYVE